jgi:hypothetical protein
MTTPDNAAKAQQEQERPESTEELREQIDHTRTELAETVEALAAKADVKGRVKERVGVMASAAKARTVSAGTASRDAVRRRPVPAALAAAGAAAAVTTWLIRRRR